ncbi:helix-turn-helix transcriptional regulator [Mesorhizobium sp. PUT5]|uniref:helix-turn-helix transcriptional regulator n=1 Tax=Mesorhizobium sp. PUT5 TaxID=3454629 RepID=UPI003FA48806
MRQPNTLPPRYLTTPEAGRFLGLSGRTLEKHRTFGTGPRYRKIVGRVIYSIDDLQAWADGTARHSTADPDSEPLLSTKPFPADDSLDVQPGDR